MVHEELEGKDVEVRGSFMTRSMVSRRRVIIGDLAVGSGLKAKIDECVVDECVGSGGREWRGGGRQLKGRGRAEKDGRSKDRKTQVETSQQLELKTILWEPSQNDPLFFGLHMHHHVACRKTRIVISN